MSPGKPTAHRVVWQPTNPSTPPPPPHGTDVIATRLPPTYRSLSSERNAARPRRRLLCQDQQTPNSTDHLAGRQAVSQSHVGDDRPTQNHDLHTPGRQARTPPRDLRRQDSDTVTPARANFGTCHLQVSPRDKYKGPMNDDNAPSRCKPRRAAPGHIDFGSAVSCVGDDWR